MLYVYSAKSELSAEEVTGLLAANVSKRPWFGTPDTLFEGKVTGFRFSVSRVVRGMDTFNPLMRGSIARLDAGCLVRVVMTLHPVAIILMVGWSLLVAHGTSAHGSIAPIAWVFVLAPWMISIPVFFYDVGRSRSLLQQCLKLRSPEEKRANQPPEPTPTTGTPPAGQEARQP